MASTEKPVASKQAITQAQELWTRFTFLSKWIIIAVCIVIAFMGIVFIDWS